MRARLYILLIAAAHVVFLYIGYATSIFHLPAPYMVKIALWAGVSSLVAGLGYFRVVASIPGIAQRRNQYVFAALATCVSLYAGVFLAFNSFGT